MAHYETIQEITEEPFPWNLAVAVYRSGGIEPDADELGRLAGLLPGWVEELREPRRMVLILRYRNLLTYEEIGKVLRDYQIGEYVPRKIERIKADAVFVLQMRLKREILDNKGEGNGANAKTDRCRL